MKILSNIKALSETHSTPSTTASANPPRKSIAHSRSHRISSRGIIFESTSGGSVLIPFSELWKLAESSDDKLAIPVATPPAI
jgi:hypothetical protein